ncbi:uncharacterized protein LOC112503892 [Cynara cardunculus var. scolymus]|uniref:DUF4408 domain-containing protein n=1 Tax=Cynara cardunculus var. scolymus TaxID=59895 RepID=A0A103WSH2_CYNCS|nr:uncharacterized protein LOC112503892 [Cynara cardunculus var. scolymus]KVH77700.1 protein of unknown function DUF4408 [Cynara cardunculus var. scolymus]
MEDSATSVTSIWASLNSWFTSTVLFILLNLMIATIVFTSNLPNNNQQQQEEEEENPKQNSPTDNHRNQPKISRSPSILHRLKSFNFYPQRPELEFSPDTHYHLQPLEVAATQYVFNQPIQYEHFDFDPTASDQVADVPQLSARNRTHEVGLSGLETHVVWEQQQSLETVMNHFDSDPTHQEILKDTDSENAHEEEEQTDKFQSLDEVYSRLKGGNVDRSNSDGAIPRKPPAKMKKSASLKVGFSHFEEEEIVEARRPATMRERKSAVRATEDDDVEVDAKADDFINKFKNDLMLQRIESIAGRSK